MEPGGPMLHLQRLSNNPYPEPIPRIDTYFFKIHSNISYMPQMRAIHMKSITFKCESFIVVLFCNNTFLKRKLVAHVCEFQ